MNSNNKGVEINAIAVLLSVFQNWRRILLCALVFFVFLGGFKTYTSINSYAKLTKPINNTDENISTLADYRIFDLKTIYEESANVYEGQKKYNAESMYMHIDPNQVWTSAKYYYVVTNYQIMPNTSIQNENPANIITGAYADYCINGLFFSDVKSNLSFDIIDVKYLKELLQPTVNLDYYSIELIVYADTKEHCEEIMSLADMMIQKKYQTLAKDLGEHTLQSTDAISYCLTDSELEEYQIEQRNNENEFHKKAIESGEAFSRFQKSKSSTYYQLIINIIKWAFLSLLIGTLVGIVIQFFVFFLTGKVICTEDLGNYYPILSDLPTVNAKKLTAIDKLVLKMFGITRKKSEFDGRLSASVLTINKILELDGTSASPSIALVSDIDFEELSSFANKMTSASKGKSTFIPAGNIFTSSEAMEKSLSADSIIIICSEQLSEKNAYIQFCQICSSCNLPVIGSIITNKPAF